MIPTVSRFAPGMSTAWKSTPAYFRPSRKCALRLSRSSLAIRIVAPVAFACVSAPINCGRSLRLPLSTSTYSCNSCQLPPSRYSSTRLALRFEAETRLLLPVGRDPQIGNPLTLCHITLPNWTEWEAADAELKALGVAPPTGKR